MAGECRIPDFGSRITLENTNKESGEVVKQIDKYKNLDTPELYAMINHHEDAIELQTDGELRDGNERVI